MLKINTTLLRSYFWRKVVFFFRNSRLYPFFYKSWWHYLFNSPKGNKCEANYFGAVPNRGAGIGHQLANWIAGYWYAKQFDLQFAHIPFAQAKWEHLLGFGEGEVTMDDLVKKFGYKKVLLPLFNEFNSLEVEKIKRIIDSYSHRKVVFVAEQDQFYQDQYGVMTEIKQKFYHAAIRAMDHLFYSKDNFNIAIHVRRGDIVAGRDNKNSNSYIRWQDNCYFERVLSNVLSSLKVDKSIEIYLFSQGEPKDFSEFEKFPNIHFCLDMDAQQSFLHMVNADLLITSKSSFSYKSALLNNGIKVCPANFWHGYPNGKDWVVADENGSLDTKKIELLSQ